MEFDYYQYCLSTYQKEYNSCYKRLEKAYKGKANLEKKQEEWTKEAQKSAIRVSVMKGLNEIEDASVSELWSALYRVHLYKKSGIKDLNTIQKVISADESWKKSSGHAFEEMIKLLGNTALDGTGIEILLQRDLNTLIKAGEIANEPRDISWLKEQIKASVFDLYAVVTKDDGRKYCYGCIQSKTSVRDRVTRDREPSLQAMASYFWSTIIVLDGDFLRLPKFISMVNGGTTEHPTNGWHGMYVFSEQYSDGRIYSTNLDFKNFKEHAISAAQYWLTQRQWFDHDWIVE